MAEWPAAGIEHNGAVSGLPASRGSSGHAKGIFSAVSEVVSSRVANFPGEATGEGKNCEQAEHLKGSPGCSRSLSPNLSPPSSQALYNGDSVMLEC